MVKALLVTVYWNGHVFNPRARVKKGRPRAQPSQSVPRWNGSLWPCPKQAFRDTAFKNQSSISLSIKAKHQQEGNSTGPGRWINLHSKELTQSKGITLVSICHSSSYRFPNNNTVQSFTLLGTPQFLLALIMASSCVPEETLRGSHNCDSQASRSLLI